ncbi:MAG: hypothetical protein ACI9J3_001073 [Parvicellaceae bacterium]|jgi:hypothetical protein
MKKLLYTLPLFLLFASCEPYQGELDQCCDGLEKVNIPNSIDRIVIADGNGNVSIRYQEETAFYFPDGWIQEAGHNDFSITGNTLTIYNTFSETYLSLNQLNDVEIVDGNSSTFISRTFAEGNMDLSIGGNASVFFDEICGDDGNATPRNGDFDLDLDVHQNGSLYGFDVDFTNVYADVFSNGTVEVLVHDNLDANIPSNGTIYYKGYPNISTDIGFQGSLVDAN